MNTNELCIRWDVAARSMLEEGYNYDFVIRHIKKHIDKNGYLKASVIDLKEEVSK